MKLWWHKLSNWEYWPAYIVYFPTFFLWCWFVIRFRSFTFYEKANPSFKNGGLYGDGKMSIYQLLPKNIFPKSILIEPKKEVDFQEILTEAKITFPLMVKPDIGLRGIMVKKIETIDELIEYKNTIDQNFIIQEYCNFEQEIGLFYCRYPNESKGRITGLTIKKFLTIRGNGVDSILELLKEKPRFEMQIPKLKLQLDLDEIIVKNEERCIVPYGNHNRGTEFLDGKDLITEQLEKTFDDLLNKIEGFYYGRLDIRFHSISELEKGEKFSIIEINGVKSEPTHIYDPKHSFWYGQKEIFRHQSILYKIIANVG